MTKEEAVVNKRRAYKELKNAKKLKFPKDIIESLDCVAKKAYWDLARITYQEKHP